LFFCLQNYELPKPDPGFLYSGRDRPKISSTRAPSGLARMVRGTCVRNPLFQRHHGQHSLLAGKMRVVRPGEIPELQRKRIPPCHSDRRNTFSLLFPTVLIMAAVNAQG
jgi:hypothetical protein